MSGPPAGGEAGAVASRRGRLAAIGAGAVLAAAVVAWLLLRDDGPQPPKKPTAQQIQLVRPATPPPPPPKPPERPPEPPRVKEQVKLDTPKPQEPPKPAEAPPPAARLGVDAAGSGQGDGFGLAANPGGRDLTASPPTIGGGGGGGGTGPIGRAQYAFYRDVVTRHVNEQLNRIGELKTTDGQIAVLVWIDRGGRIERVDLRDASETQSDLIRRALLEAGPMREAPPSTMPQPVWVLVNLRELG